MLNSFNQESPVSPVRRIARAPAPKTPFVNFDAHSRFVAITIILALALIAFEIFNFDTTKYALRSLLGDVSFAGVGWATILAIAFCGIDFAGLIRVFTPDADDETPSEVWYLMAAWLMGASMNALMTWWAVSLTLLQHDIGNEVVSRENLLTVVPIFVAVLVWLTRILFIGALSVAGGKLIRPAVNQEGARSKRFPTSVHQPARMRPSEGRRFRPEPTLIPFVEAEEVIEPEVPFVPQPLNGVNRPSTNL